MGNKTARDRLALVRGPSFPHPGVEGSKTFCLVLFK